MGLDLLDVKLWIEEDLDVQIEDDELLGLVSDNDIQIGDLYEFLLKKLNLSDVTRNDMHLNFTLWTEVQSLLHGVTDVPMVQIELRTPLEELFPRKKRCIVWQHLREESPYQLPDLDYPPGVRLIGALLAIIAVAIESFQIWQIQGIQWFWPLLGLLGIWMVMETYGKLLSLFRSMRTAFPTQVKTVKDLCRVVLANNYEAICTDADVPFDDRCLDVWTRLSDVLVNVLGVEEHEVTFRSRLFADLCAE